MKTSSILVGIAALLGIGVAVSTSGNANTNTQPEVDTPTPNSNNKTTTPVDKNAFPLKVGSYGSNVLKLQQQINLYYSLNNIKTRVDEDKAYGPKTQAAVTSFGLTQVTLDQLNWLIRTVATLQIAKSIKDIKTYIGRTVVVTKDIALNLMPAYSTSPKTGQYIKLSNGYFVQNSNLTKKFSAIEKVPFKVAYESETSVVLDLGKIVKPDANSGGSTPYANALTATSRYFLAYKKDLTITAL